MREEKLFRAIGDVGDDLIARADEPVQKKKPVRWAGIAALAACCLIAVGLARLVTMSMGNTSDSTAALDAAAPETPMMQAAEEEAKAQAEAEQNADITLVDALPGTTAGYGFGNATATPEATATPVPEATLPPTNP